ncbi:hypothetical protein EDEG_02460 [Edhazardia aedis USNM 41457]|uniref:DNA mismatch repair protein n=1 Tax=Edhazardia aedis (strain USNM 41457) TaxID=1003232 RepID=J9DKN9_EDHAE|nr:hypothetical protein EDEG_02460 [Edhazardia aedis USNM 41457]|eukprot:EJW03155.1 hypothetical protein EDEG_02460 [Edhazardia aedis USNM 41457]
MKKKNIFDYFSSPQKGSENLPTMSSFLSQNENNENTDTSNNANNARRKSGNKSNTINNNVNYATKRKESNGKQNMSILSFTVGKQSQQLNSSLDEDFKLSSSSETVNELHSGINNNIDVLEPFRNYDRIIESPKSVPEKISKKEYSKSNATKFDRKKDFIPDFSKKISREDVLKKESKDCVNVPGYDRPVNDSSVVEGYIDSNSRKRQSTNLNDCTQFINSSCIDTSNCLSGRTSLNNYNIRENSLVKKDLNENNVNELNLVRKDSKKDTEKRFNFLNPILDANKNSVNSKNYDPTTLFISPEDFNKLTDFEKQFWSIKKEYFDTVIFFKKGKFYELYENDADIGSALFGLKVVYRVNMRMAGVPEKTFDHWANKFLKEGYKIGRVEQCENSIGKKIREKMEKNGKNKKNCSGIDEDSLDSDSYATDNYVKNNDNNIEDDNKNKCNNVSTNLFNSIDTNINISNNINNTVFYSSSVNNNNIIKNKTLEHENKYTANKLSSSENLNNSVFVYDKICEMFAEDEDSSTETFNNQLSNIIGRELKEIITPATVYNHEYLDHTSSYLAITKEINNILYVILYDASINTAYLHFFDYSIDALRTLFIQYKVLEVISDEKINEYKIIKPIKKGSIIRYKNYVYNSIYSLLSSNTNNKINKQYTDKYIINNFNNINSDNIYMNLESSKNNTVDIENITENFYGIFLYLYNYLDYLKRGSSFDTLIIKKLNNINKFLILDSNTISNLDILEGNSLFNAINFCKTNQGKRLLKEWILRPLLNLYDIRKRQCIVKVFENINLDTIINYLSKIADTRRIVNKLFSFNPSIKDLKNFIDNIDNIINLFNGIEFILTQNFGESVVVNNKISSKNDQNTNITDKKYKNDKNIMNKNNNDDPNNPSYNLLCQSLFDYNENPKFTSTEISEKNNLNTKIGLKLHLGDFEVSDKFGLFFLKEILAEIPRVDIMLKAFKLNFDIKNGEIIVLNSDHPIQKHIQSLKKIEIEILKYFDNQKTIICNLNNPSTNNKSKPKRKSNTTNSVRNSSHLIEDSSSEVEYSDIHCDNSESKNSCSHTPKKINSNNISITESSKQICFKDIGKEIFQIEVPSTLKVPKDFYLVSSTKEKKRFYTNSLKILINEYNEKEELLFQKKSNLLKSIIKKFKTFVHDFMKIDDIVSKVDCFVSFAQFQRLNRDLTYPIFITNNAEIDNYNQINDLSNKNVDNDSDQIIIKKADYIKNHSNYNDINSNNVLEFVDLRNPIYKSYVPNTIIMHKKVAVLTGPNMGGKSTTMKSICLNIILAQMGLKVKCSKMKINLIDRIFTKLGNSDNLLENKSTFQVELMETAKILNESTLNSFIIIDELGRGTSTKDGECIAKSVLNWLTKNNRQCIFSTHYTSIIDKKNCNNSIDSTNFNINNINNSKYIDNEINSNDLNDTNNSVDNSEVDNSSNIDRTNNTKCIDNVGDSVKNEKNNCSFNLNHTDISSNEYMTIYLKSILQKDIVFLYKIEEGICKDSHALEVAKLAGVSKNIIQNALKYKHMLQKNN